MTELEPERELPAANMNSNPRLNETAEAIGGALGTAARHVQNVRDRFTVIRGGAEGRASTSEQIKETAQEKIEDMKQRAGSALEQARIEATTRLEDAKARASRLARNARGSATERARMLRMRAERLTRERPLQVLAGVGVTAFLLGIILRVGRAKRG
jgi:ElaB/YqjD/DUF883 family membrane-anchored ribosome-binding protein